MHEFSLVQSLLRQLDGLARQYPDQQLVAARVQIGEFSGVEPDLLMSAFNELTSHGQFANVDLIVERTQLRATCEDCASEFQIQQFKFICPTCGSPRLKVLGGDEMMLDSIALEDAVV